MDTPAPADPVGASDTVPKPAPPPAKKATATQFFLKGLAIVLPPILTLVILVWIGQMIYGYVVSPVTTTVRFVIAEIIDKSRPTSGFESVTGLPSLDYCGTDYRLPRDIARQYENDLEAGRKKNGLESKATLAEEAYVPFGERSVPYADFWEVASRMRPADWPATATGLYMELVTFRYFKSLGSLSALATALTIIGLYFLGRFVTARMGQWLLNRFESLVLARVPIISSIYSSVKQVTDFFFSERAVAYNRVVAVEFPRRGIWTIGFAMGESLMEMTLAAGEPMVSIMIPAAPMPMSGWVVTVPKSSIIDLNMTLDQAFQYFLSCGVIVPEHQRSTPELLHRELSRRLATQFGTPGGMAQGAMVDGRPPFNPAMFDESRPPAAPFEGRPWSPGNVPPNPSPGGAFPPSSPPGTPPSEDEARPS